LQTYDLLTGTFLDEGAYEALVEKSPGPAIVAFFPSTS
jgi:hypothetical protein